MEIHIIHNSWTILFLIVAIQGLLLGSILISKNYKLLGLIVMTYSVMLCYYVLFWTGLSKQISPIFGMIGSLTFLIAPLFYSFFNVKRVAYWHYAPMIFFISFFMASLGTFSLNGWVPVAQVIQLGIYMVLIYQIKEKNQWQNQVAISYYVFTAGFTLYYLLVWTGQLKIEYDYFISMIMTGFIYWVGYKALFDSTEAGTKPESKTMAYSNAFAESVTHKIESWIESQQRFLDSEYKITDLSSELDTSVHTLSHIINAKYGRGFNDWLNERRINHAKSLISDNPKEKMISIAYQSGFNNKVSFIKNFKKHTGMTPTAYKDSLKG